MAKRGEPKYKVDDRAYPVRVKVAVPATGMQGLGARIEAWLDEALGVAGWSSGPAQSNACVQSVAYYFRQLADAQRCLAAFPELELADGVDRLGYSTGKRSIGLAHSIGNGPRCP